MPATGKEQLVLSRALPNSAHLTESVVRLSWVEAVVSGIVFAQSVGRIDQTCTI